MNLLTRSIRSSLIVFIASLCVVGQEAVLFDEFGKHNSEDLMARLDSLHNHLKENPNSTVLIRIDRGKDDYLGYPYRYLAIMKTYLTNHKLDEKRISQQACDGEIGSNHSLFLVLPNDRIPECKDPLVTPGTTTLFDSYSSDREEIDNCCDIPGAVLSGATASLGALATILRKSPESRAYVIAYNGTTPWWDGSRSRKGPDSPRKATRTAVNAKTILIKSGIDAKRIAAINGGYRDAEQTVELWFVAQGGNAPKTTPNYFPKRRKSTRTNR